MVMEMAFIPIAAPCRKIFSGYSGQKVTTIGTYVATSVGTRISRREELNGKCRMCSLFMVGTLHAIGISESKMN